MTYKKLIASNPVEAFILHPNGSGRRVKVKERVDGNFILTNDRPPRNIKVKAPPMNIHEGGSRARRLYFITEGIDETLDLTAVDSPLRQVRITGASMLTDAVNSLRLATATVVDTAKGLTGKVMLPFLLYTPFGFGIGVLVTMIFLRGS